MRTFLTATEFARIVQRDKKTVIRWIHKGRIAGAKRVGHVYQIPIEQVEVYQNSTEYPPNLWQK
jgi:excisionase family DNA binding protein